MSMEDIDEDMGMGYNESLGNSSRVRVLSLVEETPTMVVRNNNNIVNNNVNIMKATYRECLKNHAISYGGHALDGCCEFVPAGPEGSLEALKCAACNCHRNFHRREAPLPPNDVTGAAPVLATVIPARDAHPPYNQHCYQTAPPPQYTVYHLPKGLLHVTAPPSGGGPSALALISPAGGGAGGEDQDDVVVTDNGGIGSSSNSKKRFRTKFTPEQKEKMKAFAERLDWRIRKQDDVVVQEFCNENGVKRQVLKVWMHNKKYTIGSANAGSDAMKFEDEEFVWWLKFIASASISGS